MFTHTGALELLREPVGNNLTNNSDDVLALKENFKKTGRYKSDIENGYIDRELNNTIHTYQRENGLKVDGIVNPGGETETTLIGEIRTAMVADSKVNGIPQPLLTGYGGGGAIMGGAAVGATAIQGLIQRLINMNKAKNEGTVDKAMCDKIYLDDVKKCNDLTKTKGKRSGAICYSEASENYATCLSGKK